MLPFPMVRDGAYMDYMVLCFASSSVAWTVAPRIMHRDIFLQNICKASNSTWLALLQMIAMSCFTSVDFLTHTLLLY